MIHFPLKILKFVLAKCFIAEKATSVHSWYFLVTCHIIPGPHTKYIWGMIVIKLLCSRTQYALLNCALNVYGKWEILNGVWAFSPENRSRLRGSPVLIRKNREGAGETLIVRFSFSPFFASPFLHLPLSSPPPFLGIIKKLVVTPANRETNGRSFCF